MPAKDYLAMIKPKDEDRLDYGVLGMKWGQRRSSAQLKVAAAARSEGTTEAAPKKAPGAESSAERYARLKAQAKGGGAPSMSDDDLKFFNARTEALAKVAKMNVTQESWLKKTTTNVLQNAAQRQMQTLADGIATKYISTPILSSLSGKAATTAAKPISDVVKTATSSIKSTSSSTSAPRAPGMTPAQSLDYIRKYQAAQSYPGRSKPDYSPSGNYELLKRLRAEGILD